MDNNQPPRIFKETEQFSSNSGSTAVLSKNFVANVFSWMVVGLLVTAVCCMVWIFFRSLPAII